MAEKQQRAAPVFSVEEEAGRRADGTESDREEETWTGRENGTVFVVPSSAQTAAGPPRWEYLRGGEQDCASLGWMTDTQDGDTTTLASSAEDTLSRDLERVSLGSLGKWTWDIHSIIIDLSTANFIDTVAIKTIKNVGFKESQQLNKPGGMDGGLMDPLPGFIGRSSRTSAKSMWTSTWPAVKVSESPLRWRRPCEGGHPKTHWVATRLRSSPGDPTAGGRKLLL